MWFSGEEDVLDVCLLAVTWRSRRFYRPADEREKHTCNTLSRECEGNEVQGKANMNMEAETDLVDPGMFLRGCKEPLEQYRECLMKNLKDWNGRYVTIAVVCAKAKPAALLTAYSTLQVRFPEVDTSPSDTPVRLYRM